MKLFRISDLVEIKYGKDHKHLADGDIPLYGSGGIMRYVNSYLYDSESILIPRKGSLNKLYFVNSRFWTVDTIFWTKINKETVFPKYLYYLLSTYDLASLNVGSAVPSLTTEVLNKVEICLPDLPTQKAIAEILSSLDDKIELNNEMNKTLEELAQTLFKRWFVDFEFPDENGNPYKSSGGEMVESELGLIPNGWRVGILSDLLHVKYGKDHKKIPDGIHPVYGSGGIMRHCNNYLYDGLSVLIPRKGTLNNVKVVKGKFWCVDTMFYTILKSENYCFYIYYLLIGMDLRSMNVGSAVPSMTTKVLDNILLVIPEDALLAKFHGIVESCFIKSTENVKESFVLGNFRDMILPKLMSGQIEV